jgi:Secretion system C-terminal sorting domain
MRKIFRYFFAMLMFFIGINAFLKAQTITVWPTADSATIRASQFSDTTQIFKGTTATPNPPTGFKGWVSKPGYSIDPAKTQNTHWDWARAGKGTKGSFWGTRAGINSTTANGAAIFNSDFLDNGGNSNFGGGVSPSPHAAELWSPIIDATGKDGLVLVFNQYFRNFDVDVTAISWSEDGGTTWKDTINIVDNDEILLNQELNNQIGIKLKYSDVTNTDGSIKKGALSKGTANFRVKFIYDGNYYFWMIDDVKLISMDYNMRVNRNWYARPPSYATPRAQADTLVFMADIENQGTKTANNVKLTVAIRDTNNAVIYTASRNYGSIKADSTAENEVFGKWMPPTTGKGTVPYVGSYIISSDNPDNFTPNDTIYYPFFLTDSLYQNELGTTATSFGTRPGDASWTGAQHSWKVGNYFFFPKGAKSTATRIRAFVDTATLVDVPLLASLYEWKDLNNDGFIQLNERTQVAAAELKVPKVASPAQLDFFLENLQGTGVLKLKDNTSYLAMIEFISTKAKVDMFMRWSDGFPQAPMQYATNKVGRARYTTVISRNGTDTDPWETRTFGNDPLEAYTPMVRMWTWPIQTDTKEILSENNKIDLFPNPTSNQLNVAFDLEKTESAVLVRIIDMSGKILKERDYDNIKKETISVDVHDIPNGVYNIQVQTIGQYRTMRFVKTE